MATAEPGACLSTKLAGVADLAELIFIYTLEVTIVLATGWVKAWHAALLIRNTVALVTTFHCLLTFGNYDRLRIIHGIVLGINHFWLRLFLFFLFFLFFLLLLLLIISSRQLD